MKFATTLDAFNLVDIYEYAKNKNFDFKITIQSNYLSKFMHGYIVILW